MKKYTLFDIMGPIMMGPSSSHTAGSCRISRLGRKICGPGFHKVSYYLYGSFADTYLGHGTDKALVAGSLDMDVDDARLPHSFSVADEQGLEYEFLPIYDVEMPYANTVRIVMEYENGKTQEIVGASIGGGNVLITQVNGVSFDYSATHPSIILRTDHAGEEGNEVCQSLKEKGYAIKRFREDDRGNAVLYFLDLDGALKEEDKQEILQDGRFEERLYLS